MRTKRVVKKSRNFFGMVMEFNSLVIVVTAVIFALGVILGSIFLNSIDDSEFNYLFGLWEEAVGNNSGNVFFDKFLKCGIVFLIWLCGFIKFGFIGVFFLIFTKGLSVGFTSSFIIKCMGTEGILEILRTYSLWNFAIIVLCFAISVFAVRKCVAEKNSDEKRKYYAVGAGMLGCVFIITLM